MFQQICSVPRGCHPLFQQDCYFVLNHNPVLPAFNPSYITGEYLSVCLLSSVLSVSPPPLSHITLLLSRSPHLCQPLFLALSPCSNQCLWWIIHSVQWGLKLFDWQLYSPVCYIINIPLSGIVAMAKAITGQRRISSLMEWPPHHPPTPKHTPLISLYPPSLIPFFASLVCPPEGHCSLVAHRAEQMSFRWPFNVPLVSLMVTLIDMEVKYICSAFAGQSGHIKCV